MKLCHNLAPRSIRGNGILAAAAKGSIFSVGLLNLESIRSFYSEGRIVH